MPEILEYVISHLFEPISYFVYSIALLIALLNDRRTSSTIIFFCYFLMFINSILLFNFRIFGLTSNLLFHTTQQLILSAGIGAYFYMVLETDLGKYTSVFAIALNFFYVIWHYIINRAHVIFDSMGFVILSLGIVFLILIYLYQLLKNVKEEPLSFNLDFWVASSILVYFLGSFVIFLTFGFLTKRAMEADPTFTWSSSLMALWGIHNVLLFLSSLTIFSSVLWISFRRKSGLS